MKLPAGAGSRSLLLSLSEVLTDDQLMAAAPGVDPARARTMLREMAARLPCENGECAAAAVQNTKPLSAAPQKGEAALRSLSLYTDGASRGNPGEAGAGIVILDENGQEVLARGVYLGRCTNNVAEYSALRLGRAEALRLGCEKVRIFLDSELIVRQLQGVYRVKDEKLRPIYTEILTMLGRFKSSSVEHVPRHKNKRADELANHGIDDRA